MDLAEYSRLDAMALADLVRRKVVSPQEVLECAAAAIDAVNPRVNAVIGRVAGSPEQLRAAQPAAPF